MPQDQLTILVTLAATGMQLVRLSLPLPDGFLPAGKTLAVSDGNVSVIASVRVLTRHRRAPLPATNAIITGAPVQAQSYARRALVTFPYDGADGKPVTFTLTPVAAKTANPRLPVTVSVEGDRVRIAYRNGPTLEATLIAPPATDPQPVHTQTVESSDHFLWRLFRLDDAAWSRIIDVRADALGTVAVTAYLQRSTVCTSPHNFDERCYDIAFTTVPDFGWDIAARGKSRGLEVDTVVIPLAGQAAHRFAEQQPCAFRFDNERYQLYHPTAPYTCRGSVNVRTDGERVDYRYLRCTTADCVPMQSTAWRRAEFVVAPAAQARLTETLEYPHDFTADWRLWDALYATGEPLNLADQPALADLVRYHHKAILDAMAYGDDFGNITFFSSTRPHGVSHITNRLNHGPEIFFAGWRGGDRRLVSVGVLWCQNFRDMSIWWGPEHYGGTRYPNSGRKPDDFSRDFEWRSDSSDNNAVTKGFDTFFLAYEQTGDPLMLEALDAQTRFAERYVNVLPGDIVHAMHTPTRNVGIVIDFVRLYQYTGQTHYLNEALRLFRELRDSGALQPENLFTEGGGPAVNQAQFITSDGVGYDWTFFKPYILGYGLAGLPALAAICPEEPRLRDAVAAMADFLARAQDPLGAWRYPHPLSPGVMANQAPEHARQIANADEVLGPRDAHLDAIERTLRLRLHLLWHTGVILNSLGAWEAGPDGTKAVDWKTRYTLAAERDTAHDYLEGAITTTGGMTPIEGLVYLPELLRFYLRHRPADRLFTPPAPDSPLANILARMKVL
jgi:hypothetical protein